MKWIGISNYTIKKTRSQRGFTLTEVTIVLGVMSLILGGLWAMVSLSWENNRQEQLKEEIFNTVKNVRGYYGAQNGIPAGTFTSLTPKLIAVNVITGDMVRRPPNASGCANANNLCADHPWGATKPSLATTGSFGICSWQLGSTVSCTGGAPSSQQYFAVELQGMPQSACLKAVMLNSGSGSPPGLYDVYINATSILNLGHGFPVKATDAEARCKLVVPATVDFIYRVVAPES